MIADVVGRARANRVLVLGGYGAVGEQLVRQLVAVDRSVLVAGRTIARAQELSRYSENAEARRVDATDPADVGRASADASVVVNCSGSEDPEVARAVIKTGADFIDVSATREYLDALVSLEPEAREHDARVLISVGLAPGLTNLLAIGLHRAAAVPGPLEITCLLGGGEQAGLASRRWTFGHLGERFPDPLVPDRAIRNFSEPRVISFPAGYGRRRAYRFDFPEQHQLSRLLGVPIASRFCLDSRLLTGSLVLLGRLSAIASVAERVTRRLPLERLGGESWLIHALARDGDSRWAIGTNQARGTASVTAYALRLLDGVDPGVHHLHDLTTDEQAAPELRNVGIQTQTRTSP